MSNYFIIKAKNVKSAEEDLLSGFFFDHKADGVSEDLSFSQLDDEYNVETIENPIKDLNIYFSSLPSEDLLLVAQAKFPEVIFEQKEQVNKDWLQEWKKGYKEFSLSDNVQVVPSWEEPSDNKKVNIFIDPGMAFGTGTHETTQIAAQLISHIEVDNKTVADIGTGTAILAILCDKLKAQKVEATEIDDVAREVAKKNISLNNCQSVVIRDDQVENMDANFDIVIANIIDGVLINIQESLIKITSRSGYLLLTGILLEREKHFLDQFDLSQFSLEKKIQQNEWLGFLLKKKDA